MRRSIGLSTRGPSPEPVVVFYPGEDGFDDGFAAAQQGLDVRLLAQFVDMGGEVVLCPLCTQARGIDEPTQGEDATAVEIHNLFLFADKVIDF